MMLIIDIYNVLLKGNVWLNSNKNNYKKHYATTRRRNKTMIDIQCRTNLDECKNEQWPTRIPEVPFIGMRIVSEYGIKLEVVDVIYSTKHKYYEVELHMPSYFRGMPISHFEKRMKTFKTIELYGPKRTTRP